MLVGVTLMILRSKFSIHNHDITHKRKIDSNVFLESFEFNFSTPLTDETKRL